MTKQEQVKRKKIEQLRRRMKRCCCKLPVTKGLPKFIDVPKQKRVRLDSQRLLDPGGVQDTPTIDPVYDEPSIKMQKARKPR